MSTSPWKQVIVEELEMLASEEQQLEYEENVPNEQPLRQEYRF